MGSGEKSTASNTNPPHPTPPIPTHGPSGEKTVTARSYERLAICKTGERRSREPGGQPSASVESSTAHRCAGAAQTPGPPAARACPARPCRTALPPALSGSCPAARRRPLPTPRSSLTLAPVAATQPPWRGLCLRRREGRAGLCRTGAWRCIPSWHRHPAPPGPRPATAPQRQTAANHFVTFATGTGSRLGSSPPLPHPHAPLRDAAPTSTAPHPPRTRRSTPQARHAPAPQPPTLPCRSGCGKSASPPLSPPCSSCAR